MKEIRAPYYGVSSGLGQEMDICKSNTGAASAKAELLPWPSGPYVAGQIKLITHTQTRSREPFAKQNVDRCPAVLFACSLLFTL